jgi:peptidoglycan/LPS O-acetylase OafA/YrhL
MDTETIHSIALIGPDLKRRLRAPCKSLTFYAHLFLAVLLGGGAGIWFTAFKSGLDVDRLSAALLTYFPALVAAALIDFTHEKQPYLRSFGLIALCWFVAIFAIAATREHAEQFVWASLGAVCAVFFWWVANGEKPWVQDVEAENATGGNVTRQLLKSDDKDWKT